MSESELQPDFLAEADLLAAVEPGDAGREPEIAARHLDTRLQTSLTPEKLQKRLLQMFYDARSLEQEQGVSVLYLALGFLKWFEDKSSDRPLLAPLILLPVMLDRSSARAGFRIAYSQEELSTNLSLQQRLKTLGVVVPDLDDTEEVSPDAYFASVEHAIREQPRWSVHRNDIVLGFFSFAKFLMYRDLDDTNWPDRCRLSDHPLVRGLLQEGFRESDGLPQSVFVDDILDPQDAIHVVEADSSQTLALEEVRGGRNLVIQGPPGTGKSQTIANIIAWAVSEGKKVLFMAEKMAALEVVKRRLEKHGLGDVCFELHSHKAKRRAVLDDLDHALGLGAPVTGSEGDEVVRQLRESRTALNNHVRELHTPLDPSGYSPYQVTGYLIRLTGRGVPAPTFELEGEPLSWSRSHIDERRKQVDRLSQHISGIGVPAKHPWRGVGLRAALPHDVIKLTSVIQNLSDTADQWMELIGVLESSSGIKVRHRETADLLLNIVECVTSAPRIDEDCLASDVWDSQQSDVEGLVGEGKRYSTTRSELKGTLTGAAWTDDLDWIATTFRDCGDSMWRWFRKDYRWARRAFKGYLEAPPPST